MIRRIAALLGVLGGFAMVGIGIGYGLPAVIIGGIVLLAIGTVGGLLIRMK
jgi:hypothetical protein